MAELEGASTSASASARPHAPGAEPTAAATQFSVLVRALLSVGLVLGLSSVATLASWQTSTTISPGPLSAGELTILHSGVDFGDTTMVLPAQNLHHLLPGENAAFTFTVTNASASDVPAKLSIDAWATGQAKTPMRILFYEGGTASNTPVGGGDNAKNVGITAGTVRGGSCSGTQVSQGVRAFGTEASPTEMIAPDKQPMLQPGETKRFCYLIGIGLGELSSPSSPEIGTSMTLYFTVHGTQVRQ